ncbi:NTP transferase domain-containing protein [Pontibacter sp. BT310]|uniref:NTP transferase domain-containing protein n=1 Tax=Pontibacter populi TaxID=890055 RepID=A0ABS6XEJ7_9BACT|nr:MULTISPECIES: sugar phosphate nucleotidyltransferase [Pontibacter]MBJ6119566.1 NTP transferase domain-containing protein [Pontibacter sp. BT310]MBR0571993.1 NTP transferase domain-containing protein [Microvirga sp. STS03]MBW3366419.1 NTP transferase domain-containing protein [Pontibacter populi]
MRIIIPMAGMGKRMRPHTLTVPKPLIPIAGKPIVQRLVEDIAKVCHEPIEEVAFIIGHFGEAVENDLKEIATKIGAKGTIVYQEEALGTAHAIMCAKDSLDGKVVVAFADTLFKADFKLDTNADGTIWVQRVEDPRPFGVVKLNQDGQITDFVEKPQEFVSDMAIIGIYYFRDGAYLRSELQYLLDNNIMDKGEYQLTNALENMKNKGTKFVPAVISEWLDCGNKNATVYTNQRYLEYIKNEQGLVASSAKLVNAVVIPPVYIGENVVIENSVVGPHASIGNNSSLTNSIVSNSIVQENTSIKNGNITNSMLGNFVSYERSQSDLSLGDYNTLLE